MQNSDTSKVNVASSVRPNNSWIEVESGTSRKVNFDDENHVKNLFADVES